MENFNYNSDHYQIHLSPLLFANLGFNYLNTDITVLLRKPLDSFEYFANSILVAPVGQRILKEETNILDRCVNPMKVYFQKQRTHFLGDLFAIVPDLSVDTVDSIENDTLFKKSVAGQSVVYFKIIQAQVENTQLDQNIEFKTISETTQIVQSGSVAFSRLPFSSESSFLLSIHPFIEKLNQYILPFIDTSAHFKSILIHEQKVSTSPKLVQLADLFGTRLGYNVYTLSFKMILRKLGIHDASLIHACSMSSKIIAELEVHLENCLNEIKNIRPCLLLIADVQSLSSTKVQTNSLFIDNADDEEEEHDNAQTNQNLLKINEKRVCILMQDFLNSISQLQNPNMNLETFSRHSFNGLPSVFVIGCLEFLELNQLNSSFQNLFQDTIVQKPLTSLDVMNILKQSFVNNLQNDDYLDMDLEKLSQILKGLELDSLSKIIQESKRIAFLRVYEYAVRQLQSKSIHKSDSGIIVDSEKQVELDDSMNEFVKDDFNHLSYMEKNEICEMILDAGYHIIQKDVEKSMELVLNNISNKPTSKFTLATNPNVSWDDIGGLERAKRVFLFSPNYII